MVHKKYIKRGGRTYGPYYYESYREGNKVKKRYIHFNEIKQNKQKKKQNFSGSKSRVKTFLYLFAALGIAFALIYILMNFQGLSGRVVLDIQNGVEGTPLSGVLKFNLKLGELIPTEAKVIVNLGNFSKEFSLSELIKDSSVSVQSGNFFAEGLSLEGSGEGFGAIGAKTIYPNVSFELRVFDVSSGENIVNETISESGDDENVANEIGSETNLSEENIDNSAGNESAPNDENQTDNDENNAGAETGTNEDNSGESGDVGSDNNENTGANDNANNGNNNENSNSESGNGNTDNNNENQNNGNSNNENNNNGNSNSENGNGKSITGEVILEGEEVISGVASKGNDFIYGLENGKNAEIVSGSVKLSENGSEIGDDKISVVLSDGNAVVSTEYSLSENGFGQEYLGDYALALEVNLSELGLNAETGKLSIQLVYGNLTLASVEKEISASANLSESIGNITKVVNATNEKLKIKKSKSGIRLGERVRWISNISLESPDNLTITLPSQADDISVKKINNGVEEDANVEIRDSNGNDLSERKSSSSSTSEDNGNAISGNVIADIQTEQIQEQTNQTNSQNSDFVEVIVNDNASAYRVEYYTDAPTSSEEETSYGKKVVISGPDNLNYTDVLSFANVSEKVKVGNENSIRIYWRNYDFAVNNAQVKTADEVKVNNKKEMGFDVPETVTDLSQDYYNCNNTNYLNFSNNLSLAEDASVTETVSELPDKQCSFPRTLGSIPGAGASASIKTLIDENGKQYQRQEIPFDAYDLDGNGLIDYVEWITPHLSNQTFQIILITRAEHLDSNKTFIEDVYDYVKSRDDNWTMIPNGDYLRVTFEKNLTNENDITLYAKSGNSSATIDVYERDGNVSLANFGTIQEDKKYKVYLNSLVGEQDTFDLLVSGGDVEFDYVVDPVESYNISFVDPTPSNGSNVSSLYATINVSLANATDLGQFIWNWNGTNYTIYNNSLVLMYNFENFSSLGENVTYVTDASAGGNNGTIYGGAVWSNSGKFGGAYTFDGSNDYINLGNVLNRERTDNFTISFWINHNKTTAGNIVSKQQSSGSYLGYGVNLGGNGKMEIFLYAGTSSLMVDFPSAYSDNSWHYIAFSYNGTSNANGVGIYADGVAVSKTTVSNNLAASISNAANFQIVGRGGANSLFNASIDEVRIWNRTLSADEIQQQYFMNLQKFNSTQWYLYVNQSQNSTAGLARGATYTYQAFAYDTALGLNQTEQRQFTRVNVLPAIAQAILNSTNPLNNGTNQNLTVYVINASDADGDTIENITDWRLNNGTGYTSWAVLNMPFENNVSVNDSLAVRDYSTFGNNGTLGGGVIANMPTWNLSGKVGGAYRFDGINDYINVADNAALEPSSITVTGWVRTPSPTVYQAIISKGSIDGATGQNAYLLRWAGTQRAQAIIYTGTNTETVLSGNTPIVANTWYHFAMTYDGSNLRIYLDGVQDNSAGLTGAIDYTGGAQNFRIGAIDNAGLSQFINGSIDEVIIFNRSLSAEQVYQLYLDGNTSKHLTTISFNETNVNENWSVAVTPNDHIDDGATVMSNNVTIIQSECGFLNSAGASTLINNVSATGTCMTINSSNLQLDCAGYYIFYDANGTGGYYGIDAVSMQNISIRNCNIQDTNSSGSNAYAIRLSDVVNATIQNNSIHTNGTTYGIGVDIISSSSNILVKNNTIKTLGTTDNYGVYSANEATNLNISNNWINASGSGANNRAIEIQSSAANSTVAHNTIYTSGTSNNWGIDFGSSTSYGIINNNTIYTGGSASGGAGIVFNGLWSNFTNNRVNTSTTGNYNRGFIVYSVGSNSYIANNIINTFGTSSAEGIYLEGPKNVTIFNNTIRTGLGSGGSNYGIDGTAGTNGTVINQNTIYTNGTTNNYGVYLLTQGNNVVSNNTIITNGSGGSDFGIYLMTTSTFNNITGNVITTGRTNNDEGMRLQSGSNNNLIRDNIISMNVNSNTNIGINVVASIRNTLINNTIGTKGTSNNYGIRLNTGASYNNLTNNTINSGGTTTLNDGVLIDGGSWNNTLTGNIINTSGSGTAHGIDIRGSNGNVFTMNNISTSGSNSYAIIISNTNWSIFNDTILNNPTQWINTSDVYYSNFTNTTFKTSFGSIDILPLVLVNNSWDITRTQLNVSSNLSYLNSTYLTIFNTSAIITLSGLSFTNARPQYALDDATFSNCTAGTDPVCSILSYSGGILTFNTTHFTNFRAINFVNSLPAIAQVILNSTDSTTNNTYQNLTISIFNATDADADSVENITDWRLWNGSSLVSIALLNVPFETNATNNITKDYSTFGNNLTLGGGNTTRMPTWNLSGKVGGAYVFDGVDDYINSSSAVLIGNLTTFSIGGWIKPNTVPAGEPNIFGNIYKYGCTLYAGPTSHCYINWGGGAGQMDKSVSPTLGVWNHIVQTYNGTYMALYLNGVLTNWGNSSLASSGTGGAFNIGASAYNGTIDEVFLLNRTLGAGEVYQIFLDGNNSKHVGTLNANETNKNEIWSVAVTPNDHTADGVTVFSNNLTIGNVAPTVTSATINSTNPLTNDTNQNLTIQTITGVSDVDNEAVENITDWRLNNGTGYTSFAVLNMPFETNISSNSSNLTRDYSTYGNNGTLGGGTSANMPTWNNSGKVGGAYVFDGLNDIINTTTKSGISGNANFTISAWIKPISLGDYDGVVSWGNTAVPAELASLLVMANGRVGLAIAGAQNAFTASSTIANNNWYHVAVTKRSGLLNTTTIVYVNGISVALVSPATSTPNIVNAIIEVGAITSASYYFNGLIDEVMVFNKTLSASQIYQLYLDGNSSKHANTIVKQEITANQNWSVAVTPNDHTADGTTVISNNITINADTTFPTINFTNPTETNGSYVNRNWTLINVTATDDALANITINLYNSTNVLINSTTTTSSPNYINITNLADGTYYFNASATDTTNNRNTTETRNVTIDTTNPTLSYIGQTPINASIQGTNNIFVNMTTNDTNDHYSFVNFDNSLVGWWRMDNSSSAGENATRVYDWSGNGNNGTIFNGANWNSSGRFGGTYQFDGVNDDIQVLDSSSFNLGKQATLSLWVRYNTIPTPGYQVMFAKGTTNDRLDFGISGNTMYATYTNKTAEQENSFSISGIMSSNSWHNIVFSADSEGSDVYIDGVSRKTNTFAGNFSIAYTNKIGDRGNSYFNGSIDEVLIFSRSLNASEVLSLYNSSASKYYNNFTNLSDGSHNFTGYAVDAAGNRNNTETRTATVDTTYPVINFTNPTEANGSYVNRNWTIINVTASDTNFANVTIYLYNSTNSLINSTTTTTSPNYVNITNLIDGVYYFNATATDTANNKNYTETRNVTIDTTNPTLSYIGQTPANASIQGTNNIFVNMTSSDTNDHYSFVNFDNSLVGWWRMDNDSAIGENATRVYDWSGNGNNGTIFNGAKWNSSGRFGGGYTFDGANDWINAGSAGSTLTDNFTLSAWIKTSVTTQDDRIIARRSGASIQWDFMKDSSSRLAIYTGTTYTAIPTNTIDDGGWHLATVVINGSSSRFYADGLPIGSTFSPTITAQAVNTEIGSFQSGAASTLFNGSIDEVVIFNRSLSASEIASLYNSTANKYYNNFTGLADGNHSFVGYAVDAAGNRNNTETRQVNVDTTYPTINFTGQTPANATNQSTNSIFVNMTSSDTNEHYSFVNFDNSLVGWWRMDDVNATGTGVTDLSGYGKNGTAINGAVQNVSGKFGKSFSFDGANDYISFSSVTLSNFSNWSVSSWVNPASSSASYYLGNGQYGSFTLNYGGNALTFRSQDGGAAFRTVCSGSVIPANSWLYVTWVYYGNGTISGFKDGVSCGSSSGVADAGLGLIYIGRGYSGGTASFNGSLDEVLIFNRSLSTSEIASLYNSTANKYYNNFTSLADGSHNFTGYAVDAAGNKNQTETRTATVDTTNPAINFTNPTETNGSYVNRNWTLINVTSSDTNFANVTIYLYNSTNVLINSTTSASSPNYVNITNNISDGIYYFNATAVDVVNNKNNTETRGVTVDTTYPRLSFVEPTPANNTGKSGNFIINVSIFDINLANVTLNWNGTTLVFNSSNSSITNLGNGNYTFTYNQTGLSTGVNYNYNVSIVDFAGNSNYTETRIVFGNIAPAIDAVSYSPTNLGEIDPYVNVTITANISDLDNNFAGNATLQWKNASDSWFGRNNVTMNNITSQGYTNNILNASFVLTSYENNITFRVMATDIVGSSTLSSNYTLENFWDCTWNSTIDLGTTAGWDQNKNIGNITINNTGDPAYTTANCSLDFRVTYNLGEGRIYYDGEYVKNLNYYSVSAKGNRTILINATFLNNEIKEENVVVTLDEFRARSTTRYRNTTAVIVSNQNGPYLIDRIMSYPSAVSLSAGNFSLYGYARNLMGSSTYNENNSAFNVSAYWVLPSGFTNVSGGKNVSVSNMNDSDFYYANTNITFSNLASMTPGVKTFTLYVFGYNLSAGFVLDAAGNSLLSQAVNVTFNCYSTSDGVYVSGCGSLDGDYVASSASSTSTTSSGGGGSSAGGAQTLASSVDMQLVRGRESELIIPFRNPNVNMSLKKIAISVSGDIAKYIQIVNPSIAELGPLGSTNITLKITSPTYIKIGLQTIILDIDASVGSDTYHETKKIALQVHEISWDEAKVLLNKTIKLVDKLERANISSSYFDSLLSESKEKINLFDFEKVQENYNVINKGVKEAIDTKKIIEELEGLIALAKEKRIDVANSERLMKLSILALEREEFESAFLRAKDAQVAYTAETKGEFGSLLYYIKVYPERISLSVLFILLSALAAYKITELQLIRSRIKSLREEEIVLSELMKLVQRETFEKKTMSMGEYSTSMQQYEKRLSEVIGEIVMLESKRLHALKFGGKEKALREEKERIMEMMKQLQSAYFDKKRIETRSYGIRLESYSRRIGEIEEKLATLEAEAALKGASNHKKERGKDED